MAFRPKIEIWHADSRKTQDVNLMLQNFVYKMLKDNPERKVSHKIDFCHYNDDVNYDSGKDDTELLGIDQLNISEARDDGISYLNI